MAWTGTSIPSGELASLADDAPLVVAHNVVDDAFTLKWTSDGQASSADITVSTAPARWVHDGDMRFGCTRTAGSATNHYFNIHWATSTSFDCIFLKLLGSTTINSVTVQIDDDGNFSSGATTVASWTTLLSPSGRFVALSLNSNQRYTGTGYMRLVFNYLSSSSAPNIAEIVIGQRRQISRPPDQSSGYDDQPYGVSFTDQIFRGRDRQRFIEAYGFTDRTAGWTPNGSDLNGLDDLETFRGIMTDSNGGTEPVLWIDHPGTDPAMATFGYLSFGNEGLVMPYRDWSTRDVNVRHEELPPFARNDSRYDQD